LRPEVLYQPSPAFEVASDSANDDFRTAQRKMEIARRLRHRFTAAEEADSRKFVVLR
jgi:hypothetical protein